MAKADNQVRVAVSVDPTNFSAGIREVEARAKQLQKNMGGVGRETAFVSKRFREAANSAAILEGPLGGVAGRLSSISSLVARVGVPLAAATAGIGGLAAAMKQGIPLAIDYERELLRLTAITEATGHAAGFTGRQMIEMADALALATLTSEEEARQAAGILATFGSITGETFEKALFLSQDVAEAMGGNLVSAATQLGKALEDPVSGLNSLSRAGVSFSAEQKEMIQSLAESGRAMEAQKIVLEVISGQLGDTAVAAASGLAGAIDTLGQQWRTFVRELAESEGVMKLIAGALRGIGNAVEFMGDALTTSTWERYQQLREEIERLSESVENLSKKKGLAGFFTRSKLELQTKKLKEARAELLKIETEYAERIIKEEDVRVQAVEKAAKREQMALQQAAIEKQKLIDKEVLGLQARTAELLRSARKDEGNPFQAADYQLERERAVFEKKKALLIEENLWVAETQQAFRDMELAAEERHEAAREKATQQAREKNLKHIQEHAKAQRELRESAFSAAQATFAGMAMLAEEGSKTQRSLLVFEKSLLMAKAMMNMFAAISGANTEAAANPALKAILIAEATAQGLSALAGIRSVAIPSGRAAGGPVLPHTPYLVNEHKPEMLVMGGQAGRILPEPAATGDVNITVVEDPNRAGQIERNGMDIEIAVATFEAKFTSDLQSGRGVAGRLQSTYGLRRRV